MNIDVWKISRSYKKVPEMQRSKKLQVNSLRLMVSTPEGVTDNSSMSPSQYVTVKKPSARKLPCHFLE